MLQKLILQNFRNYTQEIFEFDSKTTVIVGENTAGKTNLAEAIMLLSSGKSFKAQKDFEMIKFGQDVGRVQGLVVSNDKGLMINDKNERDSGVVPQSRTPQNDDRVKLEVVVATGETASGRFIKRYFVNGVSKSRNNFVGFLPAVLFRPEELDIIIDGPSLRRQFLDSVLETVDRDYRIAKTTYDKALRQRNALLSVVQKEILSLRSRMTVHNAEQFEYWDDLLITNGQTITEKREEFLDFVNSQNKEIFEIQTIYDKSEISRERLDEYKEAEIGAGNTLVGPQRDDFFVLGRVEGVKEEKNLQHFGSRGQQRLAILQLKLFHIEYVEKKLEQKPLFILDDIFSELDSGHIELVLEKVKGRQIIITTTHKEFIETSKLQNFSVIELNQR